MSVPSKCKTLELVNFSHVKKHVFLDKKLAHRPFDLSKFTQNLVIEFYNFAKKQFLKIIKNRNFSGPETENFTNSQFPQKVKIYDIWQPNEPNSEFLKKIFFRAR